MPSAHKTSHPCHKEPKAKICSDSNIIRNATSPKIVRPWLTLSYVPCVCLMVLPYFKGSNTRKNFIRSKLTYIKHYQNRIYADVLAEKEPWTDIIHNTNSLPPLSPLLCRFENDRYLNKILVVQAEKGLSEWCTSRTSLRPAKNVVAEILTKQRILVMLGDFFKIYDVEILDINIRTLRFERHSKSLSEL